MSLTPPLLIEHLELSQAGSRSTFTNLEFQPFDQVVSSFVLGYCEVYEADMEAYMGQYGKGDAAPRESLLSRSILRTIGAGVWHTIGAGVSDDDSRRSLFPKPTLDQSKKLYSWATPVISLFKTVRVPYVGLTRALESSCIHVNPPALKRRFAFDSPSAGTQAPKKLRVRSNPEVFIPSRTCPISSCSSTHHISHSGNNDNDLEVTALSVRKEKPASTTGLAPRSPVLGDIGDASTPHFDLDEISIPEDPSVSPPSSAIPHLDPSTDPIPRNAVDVDLTLGSSPPTPVRVSSSGTKTVTLKFRTVFCNIDHKSTPLCALSSAPAVYRDRHAPSPSPRPAEEMISKFSETCARPSKSRVSLFSHKSTKSNTAQNTATPSPPVSSTQCLPFLSPRRRRERHLVLPRAEGKLLVPNVTLKVNNRSSDLCASLSSSRRSARSPLSAPSDSDEQTQLSESIFSPSKRPVENTRPWSYNGVKTYDMMPLPLKKVKKREIRLVDGQEQQVEVEVYEEPKRLFLFAPTTIPL